LYKLTTTRPQFPQLWSEGNKGVKISTIREKEQIRNEPEKKKRYRPFSLMTVSRKVPKKIHLILGNSPDT
jgi:hypothetical protein